MKTPLVAAALLLVAAAFLATPTTAFHGAFWKSIGTAQVNGLLVPATADWSGRQVGQQGTVTVKLLLPGVGVPLHQNTVQVREFWGLPDGSGVFFQGCVEFVQPYVHEGVAANTWSLGGVMRNDLCSGLNDNDFTATYLGNIRLTLKSQGGFGVTHG